MKKKPKKTESSLNLLEVAFSLGYTIVLPLVGGVLLGIWLDKKFNSGPILLLVIVLLSIIISSVALIIKVGHYLKEINKND